DVYKRQVGAIVGLVHFTVYLFLFRSHAVRFISKFFIGAIVCIGSTLIVAFVLYHDLSRSAFHVVGAFLLIFVFKFECFKPFDKHKITARLLPTILVILEIGVTLWVLIHAIYGILLNTSFAQKWVLFNLYTIGYLFLGIFAIQESKKFQDVVITITKNSFLVDTHDYSSLFGEKDLFLMWLFAQKNLTYLTCSEIIKAYTEHFKEKGDRYDQCQECITHHYKATRCSHYKRIYNQILKIKRILETLKVGTIVQPTNKMKIKEQGWHFEPFQHVQIKA
ncbi:MAG: hypothetical protein N2Z76_01380, partial [Treponemataceae bacterium]|nr:hypothetical protein [Treponemataceae bacterium]